MIANCATTGGVGVTIYQQSSPKKPLAGSESFGGGRFVGESYVRKLQSGEEHGTCESAAEISNRLA